MWLSLSLADVPFVFKQVSRKWGWRVTFKVRSFRWEISQTSNFPCVYRRGKAPKPLLVYMFTAIVRCLQNKYFSPRTTVFF